nr:CPBP family intramembrane glutamate endopeptidase [Candidatus Krumholzibacteria bacterium]
LTPLFNAARGSLLIAVVYHFQMMNPIWPDAQPYDTYLLLGMAGLMLWVKRQAMFPRGGAVTRIIS